MNVRQLCRIGMYGGCRPPSPPEYGIKRLLVDQLCCLKLLFLWLPGRTRNQGRNPGNLLRFSILVSLDTQNTPSERWLPADVVGCPSVCPWVKEGRSEPSAVVRLGGVPRQSTILQCMSSGGIEPGAISAPNSSSLNVTFAEANLIGRMTDLGRLPLPARVALLRGADRRRFYEFALW
jgi:hypothetical protein